jgi:hypothetical protein
MTVQPKTWLADALSGSATLAALYFILQGEVAVGGGAWERKS